MAKISFRVFRDRVEKRSGVVLRRLFADATRSSSKTLASTYRIRRKYTRDESTVTLSSPYFWAAILDEGRGVVTPKRTSFLIWFRNPLRDDPRLRGGWVKFKSKARRMTGSEFQYWSRQNRLAKKAGAPEPMIVARRAGPFAGRKFSKLADERINLEVDRLIQQELDDYIRLSFPAESGLDVLTVVF
jgi:hypothetical protein